MDYSFLKSSVLEAQRLKQHIATVSGLPGHDEKLLKSLSASEEKLQNIESRYFEELVFDLLNASGCLVAVLSG